MVGRRPRAVLVVDLGLLRRAQPRAVPTRARHRGTMPGAEWFPGATLNYAEHALRADDAGASAVVARSQTRDRRRAHLGRAADQVARVPRRAAAGSASGRGDRVAAYLPEHPRDAWSPSWPPPASARSGRRARPSSACASVVDRFGQIDPKVLLAVDGYRYGDRPSTARGRGRGHPRRAARRSRRRRAAVPRPDAAAPGADQLGRAASPTGPARASSPCRSTTRSTCCSRRARPGCPSRSSTATAASSSST